MKHNVILVKEVNTGKFVQATSWRRTTYQDVGTLEHSQRFTSRAAALRTAERLNRQVPPGSKKQFSVVHRTWTW